MESYYLCFRMVFSIGKSYKVLDFRISGGVVMVTLHWLKIVGLAVSVG